MVPKLRKSYNGAFTVERYEEFVFDLYTSQAYPLGFRVAETPLFLSRELTDLLIRTSEEILAQMQLPEVRAQAEQALPKGERFPGGDEHPLFVQLDFALCCDPKGKFIPQLIDVQGWSSLYCFQALLDETWRKYFTIPDDLTPYFNGLTRERYLAMLRKAIVGDHDPKNVILLAVDPERQKTRIEFACAERYLGIPVVDLGELVVHGKNVYYVRDEIEIPVKRIYNRVIPDEIRRKKIASPLDFHRDYAVTWAGHPQWFYRINKNLLPFIASEFCPNCVFLDRIERYPDRLQDYVLKPLYPSAGSEVETGITKTMLDALPSKEGYLLQHKVVYAPLIETPDGHSQAEVRMMFLWDDRPLLVNNLVRMSKVPAPGGNNKTWVGSSIAYHA